ncbi:hypothetical protein JHD49_06925 [Sulfurimonas sp. SAG-AH-194-C21]|nr:hypothetical protein [Sulfurimonas sp. SAG-AH-194-C21]MDF1883668.1 hypothetical protein [Sulfurimonas sp. SAG-AH-194-C21]
MSIICNPESPSATNALVSSGERMTPRAEPNSFIEEIIIGLLRSFKSTICKPDL